MFALLIAAVFGVAINLRGIGVFVGRVPCLLRSSVVGAKVNRRLKDPSQFKDERGVRDIAGLDDDRFYAFRVVPINLISRGTINRFRGATLGTLRLISYAYRLGRRRRVCREVGDHFALSRPSNFRGGLVRSNDLTRCGHLAHFTYRSSRQAYQKTETSG